MKTYTVITRATHAGAYPLIECLREEIDGVLVKAPPVDGCVVMSQRGDDFRLSIGQDFWVYPYFSIGYH